MAHHKALMIRWSLNDGWRQPWVDYHTAKHTQHLLHFSAMEITKSRAEQQPKQHHFVRELLAYLDGQHINNENIGMIRRQCFVPWDSEWNSIVRDETAKRERPAQPWSTSTGL
jgi:hypothetical protein